MINVKFLMNSLRSDFYCKLFTYQLFKIETTLEDFYKVFSNIFMIFFVNTAMDFFSFYKDVMQLFNKRKLTILSFLK